MNDVANSYIVYETAVELCNFAAIAANKIFVFGTNRFALCFLYIRGTKPDVSLIL